MDKPGESVALVTYVGSRFHTICRTAFLFSLSHYIILNADETLITSAPQDSGRDAALVTGMALLTAVALWRIHQTASVGSVPSAQQRWARAVGISLVSVIILAWYPENWHQSLPGELLTVVVSMTLFFAAVWAWGMAFSPFLKTRGEDFIDDLASIYRWLKAHAGHFSVLLASLEKTLGSPFLRSIVNWLNPRKYPWNGLLLFGICMGVVLALAEAMGEGGLGSHFAVLAAIFAGLESAGVLVGYAFLAKPLRLFRRTSDDNRSRGVS